MKIAQISTEDVILDKESHIDGIHTFNRVGKYEVIDVLIKGKVVLYKLVFLLLKIRKIGTFDLGDRRKNTFRRKGVIKCTDKLIKK